MIITKAVTITEFMDRVTKQQFGKVELIGNELRGYPLTEDVAGKVVQSYLPRRQPQDGIQLAPSCAPNAHGLPLLCW